MRQLLRPIVNAIGFNPVAWIRNTAWMRRELLQFDTTPSSPEKQTQPRTLVVITPWQGTSVPWYTLAIGLMLARRGVPVRFVLDDLPFGDKPWRFRIVLACLRWVMQSGLPNQPFLTLSAQKPTNGDGGLSAEQIQSLARLNAVWHLRGEMLEHGREAYTAQCFQQMQTANPHIAALLQRDPFDLLLVPGGVYGTSGLWVAHARSLGIRVGSFDAGGPDVALFCCDGLACQLTDIPAAFERLKQEAYVGEHRQALDAANAEMARRRQGTDAFASQVAGAGRGDGDYDGAVLIALNSSWDAAALGLHAVFDDNRHWIVETVRFLLDHTPATVIVRQHPAERLPLAFTTDDYKRLLEENFGRHARLRFIAAADSVNSYELLTSVSTVIVYSSTIGVEAAAMGKPVITPSRSYYATLGFVRQAVNIEQYKDLLLKAVRRELEVTPQMRNDAVLCYYLTQVRNWFFSDFAPGNFDAWRARGLRGVWNDAQVQDMLLSLQTNVPFAYLNHLTKTSPQRAQQQALESPQISTAT